MDDQGNPDGTIYDGATGEPVYIPLSSDPKTKDPIADLLHTLEVNKLNLSQNTINLVRRFWGLDKDKYSDEIVAASILLTLLAHRTVYRTDAIPDLISNIPKMLSSGTDLGSNLLGKIA